MNLRLAVGALWCTAACFQPVVAQPCAPMNCPDGCCDAEGRCRSASATTCGASGASCRTCTNGQGCVLGVCVDGAAGGSNGTGGGSGTAGSGTGGGSSATGGGSSATGGGSSATGGGSGATGGGSGAAGGGVSVPKPNVMMLLDKSGSMASPLTDGGTACACAFPMCNESQCPTRMGALRAGMNTFLSQQTWGMRVGLTIFPADNVCTPAGSTQVLSQINPANDTNATLSNLAARANMAIQMLTPVGGTPTGPSLTYVGGLPDVNDSARDDYVLLVTDGLPNCNASNPNDCTNAAACQCTLANNGCGTMTSATYCRLGCLDRTGTLGAIAELNFRGIQTIVVAVGSDFDNPEGQSLLTAMASAGGYRRTCPNGAGCDADDVCQSATQTCVRSFYRVKNGAGLGAALADVQRTIGRP